jgi:hypothetical protein
MPKLKENALVHYTAGVKAGEDFDALGQELVISETVRLHVTLDKDEAAALLKDIVAQLGEDIVQVMLPWGALEATIDPEDVDA